MLTGITSTPSDGATACMTANRLVAKAWLASRRIATRVTPGAICLSSSSHFPDMLNSHAMKPVALPPGRSKLSTTPAPTGPTPSVNTMGTVRVACSNGPTLEAPPALALLRACHERPRDRAAEKGDELPPPHAGTIA